MTAIHEPGLVGNPSNAVVSVEQMLGCEGEAGAQGKASETDPHGVSEQVIEAGGAESAGRSHGRTAHLAVQVALH